jgi:NAD(P)H dehydrogenase (quinone)
MNILIIYAHPEPLSMNGAMYRTAIEHLTAAGHAVKTTDLYAMRFDPISDRANFKTVLDPSFYKQQLEEIFATNSNGFTTQINEEQEKVEWCDFMIWQFPLWWFSVPAILKGWVDRVFAMGRFYREPHFYDNGLFAGKKALLSLTTGGAKETYDKDGFNGDMAGILRPIHRGILQFVGFTVLQPHIIYGPVRLTDIQRAQELSRWSERLRFIEKEDPIEIGSY